MSYLTSLMTFLLLATHYVLADKYQEVKEACMKEHKTKDLANIKINDPDMPREAKCTFACIYEKMDVFKPDGSINKAKAKAMTEEVVKNDDLKKKFLKAIEECDGSAQETKCDTAFEFLKCKASKTGVMEKD